MNEDYYIGYIMGTAVLLLMLSVAGLMGVTFNGFVFSGFAILNLGIAGIHWFVHRNDKEIEDDN